MGNARPVQKMGGWKNHVMAAVDSSFLPHGQGVRSWTLSTCGLYPRGNLNQSQGEMRRWWGSYDGAGAFSKYGPQGFTGATQLMIIAT